jgi:hypothetical protein
MERTCWTITLGFTPSSWETMAMNSAFFLSMSTFFLMKWRTDFITFIAAVIFVHATIGRIRRISTYLRYVDWTYGTAWCV